nr:hypothetical protein [uncultured Dorea sp.]
MVKTIIFDYDGTIHNTLGIYEPAFREAYQWLSEQNVVEEQEIETAQIAGWLGLNSKEMWDTFLPELDQRYKDQASAIVGDSMVRQIRKHRAVWYPGPYLVIGDRRQDLECARSCKSPFIGCLYGYGEKGELDGADYFVKSVEEITGII